MNIEIINEIIRSFKEYFESKFTAFILENHTLFPAVQKISQIVTKMLVEHKSFAISVIAKKWHEITTELYGIEIFGRLDKASSINAESVWNEILTILENPKSRLECIILIHWLFIHKIYSEYLFEINEYKDKKQEKENTVATIFHGSLFGSEKQGRIATNATCQLTNQFGLVRHSFFINKLPSINPHQRAMDRFAPDLNSIFAAMMNKNNMPFAAGVSGHTGSLLLGAKLYGGFNQEEYLQYALVIFAYLAAGGNHSFHEVMVVARQIGINYQDYNYASVLPQTVLNSDEFLNIREEFSQFLPVEAINFRK